MSKNLKVAIIGCGGISKYHLDGYKNIDGVEIYALCDINEETVQKTVARITENGGVDDDEGMTGACSLARFTNMMIGGRTLRHNRAEQLTDHAESIALVAAACLKQTANGQNAAQADAIDAIERMLGIGAFGTCFIGRPACMEGFIGLVIDLQLALGQALFQKGNQFIRMAVTVSVGGWLLQSALGPHRISQYTVDQGCRPGIFVVFLGKADGFIYRCAERLGVFDGGGNYRLGG